MPASSSRGTKAASIPSASATTTTSSTNKLPSLSTNIILTTPGGENLDLRQLFDRLDSDSNGRLTFSELEKGCEILGFSLSQSEVKKFIQSADLNKDNEIDFAEFLKYVCEHQKKLRLVFQHLDSNQDGRINIDEIRNGLADLGIDISQSEAENLLDKINRQQTTSNSKRESGSGNEAGGVGGGGGVGGELATSIEWEQWRDYHLLHPTDNVEDIISYWRHGSNLDVGDDLRVPDELPEQEKAGLRLVNTLISGGAAGAVSRTCTAPIDRLKVLLQVHSSSKNPLGVFSGLRQLLSEGGLSGLWRGNGLNVLKIAPESAIKFLTYEKMKHLIKGDNSDVTPQQRFVAGSIAGLSAQTTIYPLEVLKTKMVLRKTGEYSSIVDCASKVYKEGGLRVFYRGYIPNALGIIPYAGIDLMVYETLKYRYLSTHNASLTKAEQESTSNNSNTNPGVCVLLFCGAVSSSCGQLASYPFALLRTKMQDQSYILTTNDYNAWMEDVSFPMMSDACPTSGNPSSEALSYPGTNCVAMYLNAFGADTSAGLKDVKLSCIALTGIESFFKPMSQLNSTTSADYLAALVAVTTAGLETDFQMVTSSGSVSVETVTVGVTLCATENNCNMQPANDVFTITFVIGTYSADMNTMDTAAYNESRGAIEMLAEAMLDRLTGGLKYDADNDITSVASSSKRARRQTTSAQASIQLEAIQGTSYEAADLIAIYVLALAAVILTGMYDYSGFDAQPSVSITRGASGASEIVATYTLAILVLYLFVSRQFNN